MNVQHFFSQKEKQQIVQAIKEAENKTSGEIRVHIESLCRGEVLDRASFLFGKMGMHKTELRNGVLIYLAVKDRQFCIIGDAGINEKVPDDFWNEITECTIALFKDNKFCEGLCEAIRLSGDKLVAYFPVASDDVNELSDDISFGK
jgi:uncharacterized membrane protein